MSRQSRRADVWQHEHRKDTTAEAAVAHLEPLTLEDVEHDGFQDHAGGLSLGSSAFPVVDPKLQRMFSRILKRDKKARRKKSP